MRIPAIILAVSVWLFCAPVFAQTPAGDPNSSQKPTPAYLDASLPTEQRVNDLVSRMTLEEKASQLVNQARAIPRLQIPAYNWWNEALHGVARAGTATVFPEPIGLAATFDTPLIYDMATAIGVEARAKHNQAIRKDEHGIYQGLDFWSPNINIFRDPRWGRGQETYGEDPFLTSRMGVAFVTGLQGNDRKYYRAIATPKHFAVHSGPETTRHSANVSVSKHDMEDTYLPAFRAAIVEGQAGSIMCAYNRINGEPACANAFLLQDQLRGAWRFNGYVVSDCGAVTDIQEGHHFAKTLVEAGAVGLKKGMDNECSDFRARGTDNADYVKYVDAVKQGLLKEEDIDVAVKRLFVARFRLGFFDPPDMVPYEQTADSEIDSEAHRQLALKAARESIVLLKNDGVLPLRAGIKKIAVAGPLAESETVLQGNYNGTPSRVTTALDGIRKQFPGAQVSFATGMNFLRPNSLVPSAWLSTSDGAPGLQAEYFSGEPTGKPQVVRVDTTVNLRRFRPEPGSITPPPGMNDFLVRWTGFLSPPESGTYRVGLAGSMNQMWFDGKLIVNDPTIHGATPTTGILELVKGRRYPVKIEFRSSGFATSLIWLKVIADPVAEAVAAAKDADVAVAVVGLTSQIEGEEMKVDLPGFSGGDRTSLDLPKEEEDLLEGLKSTGTPLIVVLMNGSALSVNWAEQNANAIVEAWYPGEEGGGAIAQTLAGVNNPAGRLPVTFYKSVEQLPPFEDYSMKQRTYRYFEGQPLYAFGYGRSYSTFAYSNARVDHTQAGTGDTVTLSVDVKNTGASGGDEVVELYLTHPDFAGAPMRALAGFQRIHLERGEKRMVSFALRDRELSIVDESGERRVVPGMVDVWLGGGQPVAGSGQTQTAGVAAQFQITSGAVLPE